jgi:hypothetical protein
MERRAGQYEADSGAVGGDGLMPGSDLGPDRRNRRWNDAKIFLRPSQGDGEAFSVGSTQIVGGGMGLRRQILDPHDFLRVCIGQRRGGRPAAAIPRTSPNIVGSLAGHGANDTRGPSPFQAFGELSGTPIDVYVLPSALLPKTVLMFGRGRSKKSRPRSNAESNAKQRDHRADGLSPAPLSDARRPGARFEQKMYSRVAFGSPLLTSREYSDNLTRPT